MIISDIVPCFAKGRRLDHQVAALPIGHRRGGPKVLMVTSRETRRWVIPKGWAEVDVEPTELAAKEAFEEAGLLGAVDPIQAGRFGYVKRLRSGKDIACDVAVFAMRVERELDDWPERAQRQRRWFSFADAARRVDEPELAALLLRLGAALSAQVGTGVARRPR